MLKDPKVASDPEIKRFLAGFGDTARFTVRFASGRWTHYVEQDGKNLGVGEEGTYAFPDDHTIVLQATHQPEIATFGFSLKGETLTWKTLKDSLGDVAVAIDRVLFDSTPWTRMP